MGDGAQSGGGRERERGGGGEGEGEERRKRIEWSVASTNSMALSGYDGTLPSSSLLQRCRDDPRLLPTHLCAIEMLVRPSARLRSEFWISLSVEVSRAEVASSSRSIAGSLSMVRAIETGSGGVCVKNQGRRGGVCVCESVSRRRVSRWVRHLLLRGPEDAAPTHLAVSLCWRSIRRQGQEHTTRTCFDRCH